eukprot:TRINITY_DN370_c0_g1_i1.p1 TRINITY_DN370_c0_g1~~TRINITY_DN370_c0_g1_i1.p1  ORF type:complete len:261 (+),score=22.56 TRINITY_DN370_c0_g1_i1:142-924(+)
MEIGKEFYSNIKVFVDALHNQMCQISLVGGQRAEINTQKFTRREKSFFAFFGQAMDEHLKAADASEQKEEPRDLIDVALRIIKDNKNPDPWTNYSSITRHDLCQMFLNNWVTGSLKPIGKSLDFALVFLTNYPECQQKVFREVSQVCENRNPMLKDRPNLPYTLAVVRETLRMRSPPKASAFHKSLQFCFLGNYGIPTGSWIIQNLWAVNMNEGYWPEPHTFKPERFLEGGEGISNIKEGQWIPFSGGPRKCSWRSHLCQ